MREHGIGKKWAEEELSLLHQQYPDNGSDIPELNRSKEAIRTRASLEGVKRIIPHDGESVSVYIKDDELLAKARNAVSRGEYRNLGHAAEEGLDELFT